MGRFAKFFKSKPKEGVSGKHFGIIEDSHFDAATGEYVFTRVRQEGAREVLGINLDTLEYNFEAIEKSVRRGGVGFGNPDSKLTPLQQFLLWKRMIQEDTFQTRDEYCNMMATYSSFEQAQQHLDSLRLSGQAQL